MDEKIRKAEREGDEETIAHLNCQIGKHEFTDWKKVGEIWTRGPDPCSGRDGPLTTSIQQRICGWCFHYDFRRRTAQERWDDRK